MREIMVNFTPDMVRAILDGRKTQTRRPLRVQPPEEFMSGDVAAITNGDRWAFSKLPSGNVWPDGDGIKPQFQPGDLMLVRERARLVRCRTNEAGVFQTRFQYPVDGFKSDWIDYPDRLKPLEIGHCVPNGCFKELVRIKRKVVRVWYERVRDISTMDVANEGCKCPITVGIGEHCNGNIHCQTRRDAFGKLWDSIYPGSWGRNDWVECTEFEGVK